VSLLQRLASQSTVIFGARLAGAGLVFLAQALIARLWGAQLLGEYMVIVATVNLIAVVMPLGFHTVGTYFAAEYRAHGARRQLGVFLVRCYGHVVAALALVLLCGPPVLAAIGQGEGTVAGHFVPVAMLAFGAALVYVNGAILVGLKRPVAGFLADSLFRPLIVLAAFLVATSIAVHVEAFTAMLWWMAIGSVATGLIHFAFVLFTLPQVPDKAPLRPGEPRRWWRFALPWVLISLATDFFFDIDLLLLSQSLTREELAVFGVCTRLFGLASFGVAAVYAVTLPDMFESEANSDRDGFNRKVGDANFVASLTSLVLFGVMLVAAPFLLMLFGPGFSEGAVPLALLCLALVIRSALGPASMVLSIHDRPYASLPSVGLGLLTLVACNFLLVPLFGLTGAALAAVTAIAVWSLAQWWVALRTAHLDVSLVQWFRNRRAAVPAE
jgi:Membrane protein involved in the export of O-antigen and teichoic acid